MVRLVERVCVGVCMRSPSLEELSADETGVDVECISGDGAGPLKVKVKGGAVDRVEVGAGRPLSLGHGGLDVGGGHYLESIIPFSRESPTLYSRVSSLPPLWGHAAQSNLLPPQTRQKDRTSYLHTCRWHSAYYS